MDEVSKPKKSQRRSTPSPDEIDKTLNRIREYFDAGLHEEVYEAVGDAVHPDTLKKYLANPEEARAGYKIGGLAKCIAQLPSVWHLEKDRAYRLTLREMNLEPESQVSLRPYAGVYKIVHDFKNPTKAALQEVEIIVTGPPHKATFFLMYRSPSTDQPKGCDGLVLMRGGHILLAGVSKHGTFFATVGIVSNPAITPMFGGALFEDVDERDISFSKIALVRRSLRANDELFDSLRKRLASSHVTL